MHVAEAVRMKRAYPALVLVAFAAAACTAGADGAEGTSSSASSTSEDPMASARRACEFRRGDHHEKTLGEQAKVPAGTIDKVVVLMLENRSFDHYFGRLNEYVARTTGRAHDVDGSTSFCNHENPDDPRSPVHCVEHAAELCFANTNHEWSGAHAQYNGGRMDGFFASNDNDAEGAKLPAALLGGQRALTYYDERDLPFYYSLAATFGIGDHYFSSLLGPTYPNRDFLYAASSKGYTFNAALTSNDYAVRGRYDAKDPQLIFDMLEARGISWAVYGDSHVGPIAVPIIAGVASTIGAGGVVSRWGLGSVGHFKPMREFYEAAKAGKLPQVTFLDPALTGGSRSSNDEHPPNDVQLGEKLASDVVNGLMQGADWGHAAMFITWDENGGIYDHVSPPAACPPDGEPMKIDPGNKEDRAYQQAHPEARFDRYGFRVPVLVVSPWSKRGHVSKNVYDHTSILRFIETRFDLPALTARDANADAMLDFFDFRAPAFAAPPALATSGWNVDPVAAKAREDACRKKFGN